MVAIHTFSIIKLGGISIKKKKSSRLYMSSDNSEVSEQKYKRKILETDERSLWAAELSLWAIYNSLAACVFFGFYPYECPIFPPVNCFNSKFESNEINNPLKTQDE
ncbi:hypothetical protein D2A34_13665 [Clostridium chromiireducens]|uniref:Uncharacterized protein n=2 Tax=Clostridium chromiireducens TaxID=225345 RepID=A0A399IMD3_9CLOT|nr:hypothetical protein [Clostridium chromiireducens]RII34203.1 hypothetical protein D2A34_13665 [Clostridium chromiireducens]